ncbi:MULTISPECIES: Tic20 family protein [Aphanizomenonaceae]|uniref:Tic20 family protein Ycf60 n=1 Tax=Dolichospermum heterosporum TAC447 TaxID=747523 RepID=A0ABY5M0D2_9CYAN|nr:MULTISPECIES: Tic20 family protein [Aphanizomenonaceae]UUO16246.1 hypothetical protein NG743_04130 [Dolichospermum heterosporum TAC447]
MSWRGSTTFPERIFACLPYLLPLIEVFAFGQFLMNDFPLLKLIFLPLFPLLKIYYDVRFAGMIIFFALWLLVVRNEKIHHFIRFNTMQAIILDIVIFLCSILTDIVKLVPGSGFAMQTLFTTIFMGILAAVVYSVAQSLMGKYAEIPAISDAVHMQVP